MILVIDWERNHVAFSSLDGVHSPGSSVTDGCLNGDLFIGDNSPSSCGSSSDVISSPDASGVSVPVYGGMNPQVNGVGGVLSVVSLLLSV